MTIGDVSIDSLTSVWKIQAGRSLATFWRLIWPLG
jgi:hypothetical protein